MFGIPRLYALLALGAVTGLFLGYVARIDHLRSVHLDRLVKTQKVLNDAGLGGARAKRNIPESVQTLVDQRDQYKVERDTALSKIDLQSDSIARLAEAGKIAAERSEEQRKLVAEVSRQRDVWITRARDAATRTEKQSAEQEAAECEQVLNSLYASGF